MRRMQLGVWQRFAVLAALAGISLDEMMTMSATDYERAKARRFAS